MTRHRKQSWIRVTGQVHTKPDGFQLDLIGRSKASGTGVKLIQSHEVYQPTPESVPLFARDGKI